MTGRVKGGAVLPGEQPISHRVTYRKIAGTLSPGFRIRRLISWMMVYVQNPNDIEGDGAVGYAELVAELAMSYADERDEHRAPLVEQIVAGAVSVIPGVVAAAVETLDRQGKLTAPISVGDEVARLVMGAQNRLDDGPCLRALRTDKQVSALHLATNQHWQSFADEVRPAGIEAVVCTPMKVSGRSVGVLSLMSSKPDFGDPQEDSDELARVFAAHAALALAAADRTLNLTTALSSRDVIGQAKGILMERFQLAPDAAFAVLLRASKTTNTKLRTVCDNLCATGQLTGHPKHMGPTGGSTSTSLKPRPE